jgi:hypothetical protein
MGSHLDKGHFSLKSLYFLGEFKFQVHHMRPGERHHGVFGS